MKRLVAVAVAAAALAVPAGASADTAVGLDVDAIRAACPAPILACVQDAVDGAQAAANTAIDQAQGLVYYAQWLLSSPTQPSLCYVIWGQPCSDLLP
jgi:phosphohistidine swiveling domain-containing protein